VFADKTHPMLELLDDLTSKHEKADRVSAACDAWHEGLDTLAGLWDFDVRRKARKKDDIVLEFLLRKGVRKGARKGFRCPQCEKPYARRGDLNNHLERGCPRPSKL
jgi:hypothetical protein